MTDNTPRFVAEQWDGDGAIYLMTNLGDVIQVKMGWDNIPMLSFISCATGRWPDGLVRPETVESLRAETQKAAGP